MNSRLCALAILLLSISGCIKEECAEQAMPYLPLNAKEALEISTVNANSPLLHKRKQSLNIAYKHIQEAALEGYDSCFISGLNSLDFDYSYVYEKLKESGYRVSIEESEIRDYYYSIFISWGASDENN